MELKQHYQPDPIKNHESARLTNKNGKFYCSECNSPAEWKESIPICPNTGIELAAADIDRGPDRNAYTPIEKIERIHHGPPELKSAFSGLSTTFNIYDIRTSNEERRRYKRLKKHHLSSRVYIPGGRNLAEALHILEIYCDKTTASSHIKEKAADTYRKALKIKDEDGKSLSRGRSIELLTAACLYSTFRDSDEPRELNDFSLLIGLDAKDIARVYRHLHIYIDNPKIPDPKDNLRKIINELNVVGETNALAFKILEDVKRKRLHHGRGPSGIAAAVLYNASIMAGKKIIQKDIAEASKVTEVTVRNRSKEVKNWLGLKYPNDSQLI